MTAADEVERRHQDDARAGLAQMHTARTADGVMDGLVAFALALTAASDAARERKRLARNARARQKYAARKAAGLPGRPPKRTPPQEPAFEDDDWDREPGCYCHTIPMPPCSWCTDFQHDPDCGWPDTDCRCGNGAVPAM
jgi:hypothetical protein